MGKAWFAPKKYGYGSGLPISWEGWAVLAGFFAVSLALPFLAGALQPPALAVSAIFAGILILVAALLLIARAKTEGGWRWRNGKD
jgi:hypothetical protein